MATYALPTWRERWELPDWKGIMAMLSDRAVAITVIVSATWLASLALAGVILLAATGHESAVVGTFVGGPMLAWAAVLLGRLRAARTGREANGADP